MSVNMYQVLCPVPVSFEEEEFDLQTLIWVLPNQHKHGNPIMVDILTATLLFVIQSCTSKSMLVPSGMN